MKEQRLEVNAEGAERLPKLGIVRPGVVLSRIDEYALAHDASGELYFLSSSQLLLGAETSGPMQATLETVEREDCPRLSDYGVLANLTTAQVLELFAAVSPLERVRKATAVTIGRSACARASTRWGIELAGWVTRYTETGSLAVDVDGDVWVTWPDKTWTFSVGYGHASKGRDGKLRAEETGHLVDIALGLDKDACDRIADHISRKRDGADSLSIVVERELTRIKQGGASPPPTEPAHKLDTCPILQRYALDKLSARYGITHNTDRWRLVGPSETVLAYDNVVDILFIGDIDGERRYTWCYYDDRNCLIDGCNNGYSIARQKGWPNTGVFVIATLDAERIAAVKSATTALDRVAAATAPKLERGAAAHLEGYVPNPCSYRKGKLLDAAVGKTGFAVACHESGNLRIFKYDDAAKHHMSSRLNHDGGHRTPSCRDLSLWSTHEFGYFVIATGLTLEHAEQVVAGRTVTERIAIATRPCVSVTVAPTAEQKVLARFGCPTDVQSTKDPGDGLFLEIRDPERLILRTGDDLRVFYPGDQRGPTDTLRAASVLPLSFNVWPVASVTNRHVIEALCESTLTVDRIALARSTAGLSDSQRIASLIFASACGVSADDTYRWVQGARRADNRLPFYAGDFDAVAWHFLQVKANAPPEKLKTAALLRFAHYARCIGKTITPQEARLWMGDATSLYNDAQVIAQVNDVWKESPPDSLDYSFSTSLVAWDNATSEAHVIPVRTRAAIAARTWRTDGDHPALVGVVWLPRTVSASDKQEAQNQWRARAADYLHTKRIAAYVPPMMPEIGCLLSEDDLR